MIITAYRNIYRLREKWNRLYRVSDKITNPFQSFIPNRIYFDVFRLNLHRLLLRPLFIYANDGASEVLFPIVVDKRNKRITEYAPLDYYDVLCSGPVNLIPPVLEWIKCRFPGYVLRFSRINQIAVLATTANLHQVQAEKCAQIPLGDKYEAYYQSLSKHQRQNLRTAYNKLEKENISYSLSRYEKGALPRSLKNKCLTLYERRKATKSFPSHGLKRIYARITKPVFKIMSEMDSGVFYVLYLKETPAAVLVGAFSKENEQFVVPILYSNNEYLRYSPGVLLINEVIKTFIKENVKVLDLARGDEAYKYAMGGITHYNYTLTD